MQLTYTVQNELADELNVWIEPFCHPYRVPQGSKLTLRCEATAERGGLLEMETNEQGLTFWFNTEYEPDAELDGTPVLPMWS